MKELNVSIEQNGNMIPVGKISGNTIADSVFSYSESYLKKENAQAISISLPLREEPYSPEETSNYFEGLLPEGFTRRSVAQWLHVDENDYLSILHGLGRECLGAISVTEEGEEIAASYEKITKEELQSLAAEGATKSAEIVTKTHLSLTGASGKVGIYYDESNNEFFLPTGTAPSTHIIKQSHVRLDSIVTNEQLALLTASKCGIDIPESFIINTGNGKDEDILFATKRYDRIITDESILINGLLKPVRLHQEDFAQVIGISSAEKYEKDNQNYMKDMFEIIRQFSSNPIEDQLKLWDMIVFDYLIGNTDAHIKNFSLLYSADMTSIRLAPAYDIVSTSVYDQSTRDMAFKIGGVYSLDDITRDTFMLAANEVGLGQGMAMKHYDKLSSTIRQALYQSADELVLSGYDKAVEIRDKILRTGGISRNGK